MDNRELTRTERADIRKLVVGLCANYDRAYGCLPLDCECYMLNKWWTGAYCKYFQNEVLPTNPALGAALLGHSAPPAQPCATCGQPISATGNRAQFCSACAKAARRQRQRAYQRVYKQKRAAPTVSF